MKGAIAILAAILIVQASRAQEKKPWNVDRLCGRLEHVKKVPVRRNADTSSEKRKALRDVSITLYEQRGNESCCKDLNAIETTRTGRGGHFEFKNKKPGNFWLHTNWSGREYKLAVVYKPEKNLTTVCSEQGIQIDDEGSADWWITVTVD